MINWHVITGSKGGIGKTLLTLLLLENSLENEENGSTFVVDLNATNADSSAILLYKTAIGQPISQFKTENGEQNCNQQNIVTKEILFQKAVSSVDGHIRHYVVVRPANPYGLYDSTSFVDLLYTIKHCANEITQTLDVKPLQNVIIDTNYHFCNLFNDKAEPYHLYQERGILPEDNLTVWFLWVYRQLYKLMNIQDIETTTIKLTAGRIELNFKTETNKTPFMHVFNPGALISSHPDADKKGVLEKGVSLISSVVKGKQKDFSNLGGLKQLEELSAGEYITFKKWIEKLIEARIQIDERINQDPYILLLDVLIKALLQWNHDKGYDSLQERPCNVIPLSVYQDALQYYTDKDIKDPAGRLKSFDIYKNFSKLMRG
jgi:hypothetical protein